MQKRLVVNSAKIVSNKTATAIALFLILTITATLVALPIANAHYPAWTIPAWCYVATAPVTIGVNQPVLIIFWCNVVPPTSMGAYGDRWKFYVDVTAPDGTNETLGPFTSDPVGGSYTTYTPTQMGTYTIVARFPAQTVTGLPLEPGRTTPASGAAYVNDTYEASTSEPVTLTVQQEPIPAYQDTPLPTGYWTRPIYGANRDWYSVAGQWLGGSDFAAASRINAYSEGPESSHILWTKSYWEGGVMGGGASKNFGSIGYYTGSAYEGYGGPSIILDGKIYYSVQTPPRYGWYCVDLYTGETIYYENNTDGHSAMPSMGQALNIEYPNQHGGFDYLWRTSGVTVPTGSTSTTTWEMLDAFTGKSICKIANVSTSGTQFLDNIGSICYLSIANRETNASNPANWRMYVWNTTEAIWWRGTYAQFQRGDTSGFSSNSFWMWRPEELSRLFDGRMGYSLNVTCPAVQGSIYAIRVDQYVIGGTAGKNNGTYVLQGNLWALSLKPGEEGRLLWNFTYTPPKTTYPDISSISGFTHGAMQGPRVYPDEGVFTFAEEMSRVRWVYSLDKDKTGQDQGTLLWTSAPEGQFNYYGRMEEVVYQGKLINLPNSAMASAGVLIAYNITTGKIIWNWTAPSAGLGETWYPYTPLELGCIADGKIYIYSTEHSLTQPLRRDEKLYCVDAETGTMMWAITCMPSTAPIIADGRILALDLFDDQIYCYGKGPSATTVTAPELVPSVGSSVMITGTVTDQSPSGRRNEAGSLDFTLKGTPAISDESMDAWMEYMFHQRPMPTNATGVEVSLDTIDPNGNYVQIGTVTSDINGNYGYAFTPDVPGTYQIIVTFAGSAAYGPSSATTYLAVSEAPPATAPPEYPQPIDNTMAIVYATIAIIIAVAIATILLLRKRP